MAVIKKDGGNMSLPIGITRGNPQPLDSSEIYYNLDTLKAYAKTGATAYVGQRLVYVDETNKTITEYAIKNTNGDLLKVQSVASDAPSDLADRISQLETETITSVVKGSVSSPVNLTITKSGRTVTIDSGIADNSISKDKLVQSVQNTLDKADTALQSVVKSNESTPINLTITESNGTVTINPQIKNNSITKTMLEGSITGSLNKADSALQKADITEGSANGTISVKGTDVKVKGLTETAYTNLDALASSRDITELENNKVNKITSGIPGTLLYSCSDDSGSFTDGYVYAGDSTVPGIKSVPLYNDNTCITVGTPQADSDSANKKYVDDTVNTAVSSGITVETTGTGKYVTNVTKTNGKISVTKSTPAISISEVTNLQTSLDAKANASDLTALQTTVSDKLDKYHQEAAPGLTDKVYAVNNLGDQIVLPVAEVKMKDYEYATQDPEGLARYINNKLYSFTPTDSDNPYVVANKEYVDQIKADLAVNAVHFKGVVTTLPSGDKLNDYSAGDIVILGTTKKEYILDNNKTWQEIGDESAYIPKNDSNINNYLVNGSISQDKVNGLKNDIKDAKGLAVIYDQQGGGPISSVGTTIDGDKCTYLQFAKEYTDTDPVGVAGIVAVSPNKDNGIKINTFGEITVANITTDIIKNGTNTFVLDGGTASSLPTA